MPVWALVLILTAALGAAVFYRGNPLNTQARAYANSVAVTSAGTYVSLRTLNAVLSSVQEIEVGGSLVVSGTAQPLKFLEPVDDTVERIADVVFAIMLVSGTLSVAMGPISAVGAGMIALAATLWLADRALGRRDPVIGMARGLLSYGAFLGLGLPLIFLIASGLADHLTAATWAEHQAIIDDIMAEVDTSAVTGLAADQGWADRLRGFSGDAARYGEVVANVFDRADDLVGSFIAILSVYVFKIFVLPALLAGAAYVVARHWARPRESGRAPG